MKDYKEILEGVINIINTTEKSDIGFANICVYIYENCPKLKDSEDERIRKALIKGFNECLISSSHYPENAVKYWHGIVIDDILSWLEKQGEQNLPLKEIILNVWELGNYWKDLTKGVCNTEHGTQLDYILKHWTEGEHYTKLLEKQGEKKTAWSEEDDDDAWMNDIISKVENNLQLNKAEIDWLKSLKEKVQTKQECSEEDEKRIANILSVLSVQVCWDGATGKKMNPYQKEITWLKSLRPQSTWKPSEDQIMALRWVLNHIPYDSHKEEISGLLEQLKKLREE